MIILAAKIDYKVPESVQGVTERDGEYERTRIVSKVFAGGFVTVSPLVAMIRSLQVGKKVVRDYRQHFALGPKPLSIGQGCRLGRAPRLVLETRADHTF